MAQLVAVETGHDVDVTTGGPYLFLSPGWAAEAWFRLCSWLGRKAMSQTVTVMGAYDQTILARKATDMDYGHLNKG